MSRTGYHNSRFGPFKSLFPGICAACHEPFPIGTPIARKGSKFIHTTCAPGGEHD